MVVVALLLHEKAGAGQATADGAFGLEDDLFREVEGTDGFLKEGEGHAQIQECGAEHVATDARGTVEMEVGRRHEKRID